MKFIFWGIIIALMAIYILKKDSKNNDYAEKKEYLKRLLNEYGINESNAKLRLSFNRESGELFYTKDKRLFHIKNAFGHPGINGIEINEINLNEILEIDINGIIKEKMTKRLIALTSTYDKSTKLDGAELKIITESESISLDYTEKDAIFNRDFQMFRTKSNKIFNFDEVKRFKLLLEKDIKELNCNK